MKTKEDIIQEAWVAFGLNNINLIDIDGWLPCKELEIMSIYDEHDFEWKEVRNLISSDISWSHYRPKSLKGIENNNGWTKIFSEKDLPKDGHYFVTYKNGNISDLPKESSIVGDDYYWVENITHYQPIIKPEKPLY